MSSTLSKYCSLKDLQSLKQILIPDYQSVQERNQDDDYDNRWNWQTSQLLDTGEDTELLSTFMSSLVAISPTSDLLAFAKNRYLALYRLKPPTSEKEKSTEDLTKRCGEFQLCLETQLTSGHNSSSEVITSVLLVPIVSQQKSSSFAFHDWTAIVVGFSSGYLKIYTENGGLVLSRLLHNESIVDIKCKTFRSNSSSNECDQLLILYQTTVVLIDGLSLYQTLRFCRSQLAKTQSSFSGLTLSSLSDESINLSYRKWKLDESEDIRDCHHISYESRTEFDNLLAQSLVRGPYGQPKVSSPAAHLFITCGENPYVGFYRVHEESGPILNELTQAMVNKVKNMIPFGGLFGGKSSDNQTTKIEPPTHIPLRMGLWDQRLGLKISLSPNKRLAAVIDDFGRVTLIDTNNWIAVRMWKGYREAQVGWIEVYEEVTTNGQIPKRATFIIIYAPKRGILEVWVTQLGPRVGAFNVGKNCRLIQCQHSMMGLNSVLINQFKDSANLERSRCFLFDYNSGDFYEIHIPFLCAMTDHNSKEIRDLHLLRELQQLVQKDSESVSEEKVIQLISMLRTAEVRRDALKELCSKCSDIKVIRGATAHLKQELMSALEKNELDFENKLIAQMCSRILQICDFYDTINSIRGDESYVNESSDPPDIQSLIEDLNWTGSDIARLLSLIAFRDALNSRSDRKDSSHMSSKQRVFTINEILSQFSLYSDHIHKLEDKEVFTNIPIELNIGLSENKTQINQFLGLSNFIFTSFLQNSNALDMELVLRSSGIMPSNLIILIFISWLSSKFCNYWKCWLNFSKALDILINNLNQEKSCDITEEEDDLLSDDWKEILDVIYSSDNIMAALVSVHMIKAINTKLKEKTEEKPKMNESSDMEWETLHIDNESLNSVAKQLEDLFLLDMLLHSSIDDEIPLSQESEDIRISLSYLLQSGPGIVSELVAKWVINARLRPDMLSSIIEESMDSNENPSKIDGISVGVEAIEFKTIDLKTTSELLDHVRRCFPNCLEPDVLLVNSCWELMVRWNKDPSVADNSLTDSLEYLNYVSSAVLKHNVGCLLWKTFILKRFETLSNLMEKMGRTPKDRICMKELGIHENRIESFVDYSQQLLDLILSSSMTAEMEPMPLFSVDDWWKSSSSAQSNPISGKSVPLVILAVHQKTANGALVLEHSRLATVIQFIVTFQLKSSKPLSLFADLVRQYLFKELHTFPVCSTNSDPSLSDKRLKFLLNVISAVVQTLPVHNETESDYFVNQSKHYSEANKWFGKVITLSREWDLVLDQIRRKYVYELYFHGCDPLAEEALTSVIDVQSLGSELLTVAGLRVLDIISKTYGSVDQLHTLSTNIMFWFKSLDQKSGHYSGCPTSATLALLQHIYNYVYSDKTNARICESMIETIKIIDTNSV